MDNDYRRTPCELATGPARYQESILWKSSM